MSVIESSIGRRGRWLPTVWRDGGGAVEGSGGRFEGLDGIGGWRGRA